MSAATIIEKKRRLDGTSVDFRCDRLLVEPGRRAILRYVIEGRRALTGTPLVLEPGTVTIAHYWVDRPYNVYRWLRDGRTLGYYCSIADATVVAEDRVEYTDLVVDVFIDAEGHATVLDEDELPPDLDPPHRKTIARALEEIVPGARRIAAAVAADGAPFLEGRPET